MKKSILTLLVIVPIFTFAQKEISGSIVTMTDDTSKNFTKYNDGVSVSFYPKEYFWGLNIKNKLKTGVTIIWDKSSFIQNGESSKIIFDNTTNILKNNPIQDDEIPSESYIIKEIFPLTNFLDGDLFPTISKRFVKSYFKDNSKPWETRIIIAFKISGELKKYEYRFELMPKIKK